MDFGGLVGTSLSVNGSNGNLKTVVKPLILNSPVNSNNNGGNADKGNNKSSNLKLPRLAAASPCSEGAGIALARIPILLNRPESSESENGSTGREDIITDSDITAPIRSVLKLSPSHANADESIPPPPVQRRPRVTGVAKRMKRATIWSIEVENAFRFQAAGWRDEVEYLNENDPPDYFEDPFPCVRMLKAKKTGYFMYFRSSRECEDKHLNKIKIYEY